MTEYKMFSPSIADPPILNLSLGSNLDNNNIKEGDDVYFECDVSGNPEVTSVEWYHNVSKSFIYIYIYIAEISCLIYYLAIRLYTRIHNPIFD